MRTAERTSRPPVLTLACSFAVCVLAACQGASGTKERDGGSAGGDATAAGGSAMGGSNAGKAGADGAEGGAAGVGGAAGCQPFVMPTDCTTPPNAVLPTDLRCTGLYSNFETRALACGVVEFAPAYALWSDGADKRRFVSLPPGSTIDVTDPDDFQYPLETSFWKEFRVTDGSGKRLGETRLLRKIEAGWVYTTYVWSTDGTRAVQENAGVPNLDGTGHTVPSRQECKECHSGRPDYVLGWDALMLGPGATGITRGWLLDRALVTWAGMAGGAPSPLDLAIPGDAVERAALGYLHANCGVSCHNPTSAARGREAGLLMRLDSQHLAHVQDTPVYTTGLNRRPSPHAPLEGLPALANDRAYVDLNPLFPEASLIFARMNIRGIEAQMPLLGTNRIDAEGLQAVRLWIEQMTPERGYQPAP